VGGALSTPITNTLNAIGKISITLKLMVVWTILTWVVTPICIYFYGYNGVAFAALLISFTSFLPILYIKKIVPIAVMDQVWRQGLAAVGMVVIGFIGQSYWSTGVTSLLIGMVTSAVAYGVILLIVGKDKLFSEFRSLKIS
jgi:O-antigen/teichoic acid export membrane protein